MFNKDAIVYLIYAYSYVIIPVFIIGQDGAMLPARDCPFRSCESSFLSPKLFSAKVKRSFVFSLSLWNQKKRQR